MEKKLGFFDDDKNVIHLGKRYAVREEDSCVEIFKLDKFGIPKKSCKFSNEEAESFLSVIKKLEEEKRKLKPEKYNDLVDSIISDYDGNMREMENVFPRIGDIVKVKSAETGDPVFSGRVIDRQKTTGGNFRLHVSPVCGEKVSLDNYKVFYTHTFDFEPTEFRLADGFSSRGKKEDYYPVVINEDTLAIFRPHQPRQVSVLSAPGKRAGDDMYATSFLDGSEKIRPATILDFEKFGVPVDSYKKNLLPPLDEDVEKLLIDEKISFLEEPKSGMEKYVFQEIRDRGKEYEMATGKSLYSIPGIQNVFSFNDQEQKEFLIYQKNYQKKANDPAILEVKAKLQMMNSNAKSLWRILEKGFVSDNSKTIVHFSKSVKDFAETEKRSILSSKEVKPEMEELCNNLIDLQKRIGEKSISGREIESITEARKSIQQIVYPESVKSFSPK